MFGVRFRQAQNTLRQLYFAMVYGESYNSVWEGKSKKSGLLRSGSRFNALRLFRVQCSTFKVSRRFLTIRELPITTAFLALIFTEVQAALSTRLNPIQQPDKPKFPAFAGMTDTPRLAGTFQTFRISRRFERLEPLERFEPTCLVEH